jgi:reverse gyrase
MQIDGPSKWWLFSVFYNVPCMNCRTGRFVSTHWLKARFCSQCIAEAFQEDADLRRVLTELRNDDEAETVYT